MLTLIHTFVVPHCHDSCWVHKKLRLSRLTAVLFKLFMLLIVRPLWDVDTAVAETMQSPRNESHGIFWRNRWWSRCYREDRRKRRMYGRWPDAAEDTEKRFSELSVVDEVESNVVGCAEDSQSELNQDESTGRFGTAGLAGHFLQEQNKCVFEW